MLNLINDNKGFLSLIDSLLSIFLILMVLVSFNMVMDMETPSLSRESHQLKTSQDIMEIMSSKIDGRDYSILERISYTLSSNNNSISSRRDVKKLLDEFFASYFNGAYNYKDYHYSFIEINQLNGEVLSSNGDFNDYDEVSVAIRNYGNYSYKLYIFKE